MASSPKQPGFLTKMVSLIRATATDRGAEDDDSERSQEHRDKLAEREEIQAQIARRRRNDRIRGNELNYLRKVRAEGLIAFPGPTGRPSVFQNSSVFNPDLGERIQTVRKIDAIEAQMSMQWADMKKGVRTATPQATPTVPPPTTARTPIDAPAPVTAEVETDMDLDFTGLLADSAKATLLTPLSSAPSAPARAATPLDAAARLFAQGDDDGAEAALLAVLQSPDAGDVAAEACSAALLDLYRATGQQSDFDLVAIEYAQLFGRSAPEWFVAADIVATTATRRAPLMPDAGPGADAAWHCPSLLTSDAVASLHAMTVANQDTVVDWGTLSALDPQAVAALQALASHWAATPIPLRFQGEDTLLQTLAAATPSGDRSVDKTTWAVRLELLRVLGMETAFEDAALDFCITYEISPPSWEAPRCTLVRSHDPLAPRLENCASEWGTSTQSPILASPLGRQPELSGILVGDIADVLEHWSDEPHSDSTLAVSCAKLVRTDPTAANSLLQWVQRLASQGSAVHLLHVSRLVAAYFDIVGISAHAMVLTGKGYDR